jgi:uncharacterized membrane protein YeaQ/YmgE (transglycosylase-associated protein family)
LLDTIGEQAIPFADTPSDGQHKVGLHFGEVVMWLLWVIIVGLIAGWAAGRIMGGGGYGVVIDCLLGIAGGIVGGFVLRAVGLYSSGGLITEIIVATFGAVILIWISRKLKKA